MASELKGKPFTLARAEFRVDGKVVAIVAGFSYNRQAMVSEVRVSNRLHRADAPVVGYRHTISMQFVKAVGAGLVALGMAPSVGGTHEQQLLATLEAANRSVDVYDTVTKTKQYECQGITVESIGENSAVGSHSQGSWSASCDVVLMEGEF